MNRTTIFASIVLFFIVSWLIGFINDLNNEIDTNYELKEKSHKNSHLVVDIYGNRVLVLNKLTEQEKKKIWNNSNIKIEMLKLFPYFTEMKLFIREHIEDDGTFTDKLLSNIEHIEFEYIGGRLDGEGAKKALINF